MTTLREQALTKRAEARTILKSARAAGRDISLAEESRIDSIADEADRLDMMAAKSEHVSAVVDGLAAAPAEAPPGVDIDDTYPTTAGKAGGSVWAKSVIGTLTRTAGAAGLKNLLSGEVTTPPAIEVVEIPGKPTQLLDLIARVGLDQHTYSYLRQSVRDEQADVVADGGTKPTSIYTFDEVEDRARVVAHLSEAFPLRYLSDHDSMASVLDGQMRTGVIRKVEQQLVSGTGLGEQFTGILATSGVTSVPFAGDAITTLRRARTVLETLDETPTAWVLNPTDVEAIELLRTDAGAGPFLLTGGSPDAIFGPNVTRVSSTAVPAGTALLADWRQLRLRVRQDASTLAATQSGDLFETNRVRLRAEGRYGIQLLRPQAIAVVQLTA